MIRPNAYWPALVLALAAFVQVQIQPALAQGGVTDAPVTLTGTLTIVQVDDPAHQRTERLYFLTDLRSGARFKLRFAKQPPGHLRSGAVVKARGRASGNEFVLAADGTTGSTLQTVTPAATLVSGDQKTLVMAGNFTDTSISCPVDTIRDLMFTDPMNKSVDDLYRETTGAALSFTGQVVGPYAINYASTTCDFSAWADALDAAAKAARIDMTQYSRKVYVLPRNACPAAGLGTVGGNPSQAWVFNCSVPDIYAHELGHNLGMGHASTPDAEYGDNTDIMGLAQNKLRQVNAAHKHQMGWVPTPDAVAVSASGVFSLAPLELSPGTATAPQALTIAKSDTGDFYYVSYRRKLGFDTNLSLSYVDRLSVHRYKGDGSADNTQLLALLTDGQSYVDAVNGITVTQVSHSADYSTVQVQLGSTCKNGPPAVAVTPADQGGSPGSAATYAVAVTNTDWAACPQTTFNLAATLPAGWTGSVSPSPLTIAPGQTATATLSVAAPATAAAGTYGLSVAASDPGIAGHGNTDSATYTVSVPCTRSAPALAISPSRQGGAAGTQLKYTLNVTNKDTGSCTSSTFSLTRSLPSGWSGALSASTLTLTPGQSSAATLTVASSTTAVAGAYDVAVQLVDGTVPVHVASGKVVADVNVVTGDTTAPTTPTGLKALAGPGKIRLSWNGSSDNVGVTGYGVWRNNTRIATASVPSYVDTVITPGSTYTYYVVAYDAAGNASGASGAVTVKAKSR
jgi:hypothetical protein